MKATRKLIPAVVMLLVSAVLLSTASYAWFSMNTTVTATGLSVTAETPKSLLISKTSATEGFSNTVALEASNSMSSKIYPVTDTLSDTLVSGTKTLTFKKLTGEDMKNVNPDGTIATGYTATMEDTGVDYFFDTVWLSLTGSGTGTSENITVSAAITTTSGTDDTDDIWKAIHVGIVTPDKTLVEISSFTSLNTATAATPLSTLTYNAEALAYNVYVWIDGPDSDCTNANSVDGAAYTINLTFAFAS